MAYVYEGNNYRGGATGVTNDFDLRQMFAQMAGQGLTAGMNMPTAEQIERARGDFGQALSGYQNLATNGMYTGGEMDAILSNRVQQVNNSTKAMQQNINAQMAARGMGGNAGAQAALSMAGQFNAAGQRGQQYGDLMSEQAQSRVAGLEGLTGVSGALAGLASMPTRMDVDENDYMKLYDQWRNSQIGYDGAKWGTAPAQPDYYDQGGSGFQYGNTGGGTGTGTAPPFYQKKKDKTTSSEMMKSSGFNMGGGFTRGGGF